MDWFIQHVLPRLPADVELKIVGVCPPDVAARLARDARVTITGRVESITDATADCSLGIAPIRSAAGVQNKVLEYFALGLPVVTTANVVKGLLPGAESCVAAAETPEEWQQAIHRLYNQPGTAQALAKDGRAYVESRHDWAQIGNDYRNALHHLACTQAH
jgi:glycosyltransferase involved in cell wall biosynthesis